MCALQIIYTKLLILHGYGINVYLEIKIRVCLDMAKKKTSCKGHCEKRKLNDSFDTHLISPIATSKYLKKYSINP